jgi:hypothetical protein
MPDSNEAGMIGGSIIGAAILVGAGLLIRGAYRDRRRYGSIRNGGSRRTVRMHRANGTRKA